MSSYKQNVHCEFSARCFLNFAFEIRFNCSSGFEYAGLQTGSECRCGAAFPAKAIRLSEDRCNISCPGNKSEMCGSIEKLSLYRTGFGGEYLTLLLI